MALNVRDRQACHTWNETIYGKFGLMFVQIIDKSDIVCYERSLNVHATFGLQYNFAVWHSSKPCMGRPCASPENKMAALAFATMTTQHSSDPDDLLARCGRCSLFATLQDMFPHIVRVADIGERDGISEVEFNKLLQVLLHYDNGIRFPKSQQSFEHGF
jgi:hypothetical protein